MTISCYKRPINLIRSKICSSTAMLLGKVPFGKSCTGETLTDTAQPDVRYWRCSGCDFLFAVDLDDWDNEQFLEKIYNNRYLEVDPEADGSRATANAGVIAETFKSIHYPLTLLDYGGGNGEFSRQLANHPSLQATSYDPYLSRSNQTPQGRYAIITCFEVFEHVVNPHQLVDEIVSLMADESILIFSTLVQPADMRPDDLSWWYLAPRNGHVSLYSRNALSHLLSRHQLKFVSFNDNLHAAFRYRPRFASHFIPDHLA